MSICRLLRFACTFRGRLILALETMEGGFVVPRIIVTTDPPDYDAPVTLDEHVDAIHVCDQYAADQLMERLTWAIEDAERVEEKERVAH